MDAYKHEKQPYDIWNAAVVVRWRVEFPCPFRAPPAIKSACSRQSALRGRSYRPVRDGGMREHGSWQHDGETVGPPDAMGTGS